MNWMEDLLIIGGVTLDIFATMEWQGSVVAKIKKRSLAVICGLICIWQMAAFSSGKFLISFLTRAHGVEEKERLLGNGAAIIIFAGLGLHLLLKAIRNENIRECREAYFNGKRIFCAMTGTGAYTLLAGIAFGFAGAAWFFCMAAMLILSAAAVIIGTYTGYHFGFTQRKRAYIIGAVCMWTAGAELLLRSFG